MLTLTKSLADPKMLWSQILITMEEVGSSIPGCEISSLLDGLLASWSTASCALALACRHSISK